MNWQALVDPAWCRIVCVALLHSLWQAVALAAVAVAIGRLLRKQSVQAVYVVHVVALVGCFVAVPVSLAVLAAGPRQSAAVDATAAHIRSARAALFATTPAAAQARTTPSGVDAPSQGAIHWADHAAAPLPPTAASHVAIWLTGLYTAGVVLMVVRLARSVAATERLRRRARLIDSGPVIDILERLASEWRMRALPALAWAESVAVPTVVGLLRPTILLPAAALGSLAPGELELILAHELADALAAATCG